MKSVTDMSRREIEKYNTMRKTFSGGRIPVWMLNPILIQEHNQSQPSVSVLDMLDTVSLDRLAMFVAGDIDVGVKARSFFKHMDSPIRVTPLEQIPLVASKSRRESYQDIQDNLR